MSRPKFILIDGHSLAYRAFYALPTSMINTKGQVTNAVFGFTRMLLNLVETEKPAALAVAFDLPKPTFRHKAYAEYKAHRPPAPEEFKQQIPMIKRIVESLNIPIFEKEGFEADDLLGTLAHQASAEDFDTYIVTGDTDALQLVAEHIQVMIPKKGVSEITTYNEAKVVEKYSLLPKQLIDYKSLKGDASDNIPGVPGIGDKTAIALLQEYGSLENLLRKLNNVPKASVKAKLEENKDLALLSRTLATIDTQVPLKIKPEKCQFSEIHWEKLIPVLKELELKSLAKKHEAAVQEGLFSPTTGQNQEIDHQKTKEVRLMKYLLNPERGITDQDIQEEDLLSAEDLKEELKEKGLYKLYADLELPLSDILEEMENTGIKIDVPYLLKMSKELNKMLVGLEKEIFSLAQENFNLNSPKQLSQVLFEKLNLPIIKKTKTGYSTDSEVLETLAEKYEIASKIIEFRQIAKLKNTYVDTLPALAEKDPQERIHTSFNQTTTATGRLSSSNPNLQNIPVRSELGKKIRAAFIPGYKDWKILSADYSQIELRILAHISQDTNLIEAFQSGKDIHKKTASEIFETPLDKVTPELRSKAKAVNFGIVYGISAMGLAKNTGVTPEEANIYIQAYFKRYPKIKDYMDKTLVQVKKLGYVETLLCRRRYIHDIRNPNKRIQAFAERAAINAPIQGTAADIIKLAMLAVAQVLKSQKLKCTMLLQVHDELIFELPENEISNASKLIKETMQNVYKINVPLIVDINTGDNWMEAK
ncbi:MAG: DNA polymerase I [Candidatus Margulisbacteria bacterium]|nr:DNA polymerase I [Candidatus Margulisiibacteriota bacterium]